MKKNFLIILTLLCISVGTAYADSLDFIIFQPETLPSDVEKTFLTRLDDSKAMTLPAPEQKLPKDPKVSDVWLGNRPYMKPSVETLKLTFSWQESENEQAGKFDLDLEFTKDGVVIRHSNPLYPGERGGYRIGNDKFIKPRKFYIRGKNSQSLAVFVPAYAPSEKSRGMLFCPRDFLPKGTRIERASLQATNYKIVDASGTVKSEMTAYLNNPINFVLAEAKLLTTPGVPPALINYDRSYAKDAAVSLLYKENKKSPIERFKDFSNFSIGIENFLNLHFSTGYRRISKGKALVYVKDINIPDTKEIGLLDKDVLGTEFETELKLRGIPLNNQGVIAAKMNPGSCYLVLYRVLPIIHEYLEQDFVIPKDFAEAELKAAN